MYANHYTVEAYWCRVQVGPGSVRNDTLKLRLLLIGANSWGKGGNIFFAFMRGKGIRIVLQVHIIMICNDIKAVNPVDKTCLNQMIF